MNMMKRILIIVMTVIVCLSAFPLCTFAEASDATDFDGIFVSEPIGKPEIDIELLIKNRVTKELVDEIYYTKTTGRLKEYTLDHSIYLLEYPVSTDYWNNVSSMDYKGLTDAIYDSYPNIYIPLFGDVSDSKGKMHNRVIGHVKLTYDWSDKDYRFSMGVYDVSNNDYKDKKTLWISEKISEYLKQNETVAEQVFLIKYPSSVAEHLEKEVAVIKTKDDTIILDITNSLRNNETGQAIAYNISEYRALRMEIEKEIYQVAVGGWENNPADHNNGGNWIIYVTIVTLVVVVVSFLLVKKHRNVNKN